MATVPAILHQTWKTEQVPAEWTRFADSWKAMHPAWQYRLWTDEANRAFVAEHYPELLPAYDGYSYAIHRADAVRYCLLHHFGGVYVDLDVECLQPVDALVAGQGFMAVLEPEHQGRLLGSPVLVSNAFMSSTPGHPFLAAVIEWMIGHARAGVTHRDVLETTGPLMLTAALAQYMGESSLEAGNIPTGPDVTVLQSHVAFPMSGHTSELDSLRRHDDESDTLRARLVRDGSYAVHYWANSWVGTLAGELVNPEPLGIPGFVFHRGLDSPGHDVANVGRNIREAAEACSHIEGAVAFNTDGMVKDRLLPRREWLPMGRGATNEGLYVRHPMRGSGVLRRVLSFGRRGR